MRVKVTQDHIDKGQPDDCGVCPIARAVDDAFGVENALVWDDEIEVITKDRMYLAVCHSKATTDFMLAFDEGKPVKPFQFNFPC